MDFALDDTQQAVAGLTREILTREPDPDSAWKALAHAGLLTGDGLGVLETAVVLYEIGRTATRLPALSTLALGVLPLGTHDLLTPVGAGERLLTAALRGSVTVSGGNLLSGKAIGVPDAADAYRILVPAGDTVFLVSPEESTLTQKIGRAHV